MLTSFVKALTFFNAKTHIFYFHIYNERSLLLETANAMIPLFHLLPENEKFSAVMQSKTPKLMKALGN